MESLISRPPATGLLFYRVGPHRLTFTMPQHWSRDWIERQLFVLALQQGALLDRVLFGGTPGNPRAYPLFVTHGAFSLMGRVVPVSLNHQEA